MKNLVVMVRYLTPLSESPALQGLCDAFSSQPDLAAGYTVMIWDNSPEAIVNPQLPIAFLYRHSETNLGVSGAYNGGAEYALEHGYPWMLLLDQDTKITSQFLLTMLGHCQILMPRQEIAAIAPTVRVGGTEVSPNQRLFGRVRSYTAGECGIVPGEATAINSGCMIRVASLQAIGGFSSDFWLDYSDVYVFHQFFLQSMKMWQAADAELAHDLSIMDYDRLMPPWRSRNFSAAESAFSDLYLGHLENALLTLRLLLRAIKHRIKYDNPEFSRIALTQFMRRLRVPRAERIAQWHSENRARVSQQTGTPTGTGRHIQQ